MQFENLQKFVIVLLYGGLILQSHIVLSNPMNVNKRGNFFFGLFLFFWSTFWFLDVLTFCGFSPNRLLIFIIDILQIFTPIFLFFSAVFFINPNYRFRKNDLYCFIIPFIYFLLLLNSDNKVFYIVAMFIGVSHNLLYIIIIYFKIRHHQKRIQIISSNTENINLQWFIELIVQFFIILTITVCYELYNIFIHKRNEHFIMDLLFLIIAYSASRYSIRQKEIYPTNKKQREELLSLKLEDKILADKKKLIPDNEFEDLRQQLITIMETEKPYLDGELNLLKLSDLLQINIHQLSYLLNTGFNQNFFQFVNKYRIDLAKKLLLDNSQKKFSILGIAYESGFNSKTSFNTIFKKMTKLTPSEFKKKYSDL
jgi:AraC-like DNA-binding protein